MAAPIKNDFQVFVEETTTEKKICVSIDFGTSGTGYAYSFVDDKTHSVFTNLKWEGRHENCAKTLSQIVYKNDKPVSYGFPALKMMTEISEEEELQFHILKYFKMDLFKSTDGFVTDPNAPEGKYKVIDVIVDYLKLFFEKIKKTLNELKIFDMEEIVWCLTIPAIWKDEQKEVMKIVAERVGLVKSKNDPDLLLILEPEAAAAYCLHMMKDQGSPIKFGETFIVVDAGKEEEKKKKKKKN